MGEEQTFAQFVKTRRIKSEIKTQTKLAGQIGVNRATLAKIEQGEMCVSFQTVRKILSALNTNFTEFEQYERNQTLKNQISQLLSKKDQVLLIEGLKEFNANS